MENILKTFIQESINTDVGKLNNLLELETKTFQHLFEINRLKGSIEAFENIQKTQIKDQEKSECYLIKGAQLCTLNGLCRTNGIITKIENDVYHILTDFGNILKLSKQELFEFYIISPGWIEHKNLGYPFQNIPERIKEQISNLERALELYIKD